MGMPRSADGLLAYAIPRGRKGALVRFACRDRRLVPRVPAISRSAMRDGGTAILWIREQVLHPMRCFRLLSWLPLQHSRTDSRPRFL